MSQSYYDQLVRGVKEFQSIAQEQTPFIGRLLDDQLTKLQEELKGTQYGNKVKESLRRLELEDKIRVFIRRYRPQLVNLASQHNPYLERGLLTPFIHRPVFFKLLKEEKDLHFNFETTLNKNLERFKKAIKEYDNAKPLTIPRLTDTGVNYYHQFRGTPTGGHRPKRLIPVRDIFSGHHEENYYRYKNRPMAVLKLAPYRLIAVFDFDSPCLHIHSDRSGTMTPKWETYHYPRRAAWPIHEVVVVEALRRALRNNEATPLPKVGEEEEVRKPKRRPRQRRTNALEATRKKLTPMTRKSYFDPTRHRVDILVPITKDGEYCSIQSEHADHLLMFEIHPDVPEADHSASRELFREILPYAKVNNPGEAVPLRDFIRFAQKGATVRWMSKHLRPVQKSKP